MQIEGTVTQLLEEVTGEGKNGTWRKQEFILETGGKYPKQVCIVMWGDSIDEFSLSQGRAITAHLDIASREYNGRWYTDVKAWKVEGGTPAVRPGAPTQNDSRSQDDLPF